jgi:hypothetical protein
MALAPCDASGRISAGRTVWSDVCAVARMVVPTTLVPRRPVQGGMAGPQGSVFRRFCRRRWRSCYEHRVNTFKNPMDFLYFKFLKIHLLEQAHANINHLPNLAIQ